jgi:hypothetical protein
VQKPATVHYFKKSNVWAVLVNLVTPRQLEGKMRSGRQKFERQTQEVANDLCVEVNAQIFGKELARQLTKRETDIAKKVFWELLEPKHPDWINHVDKMVEHCEKTSFRVHQADIPNVIGAAKIFWAMHVLGLEPETRMGYRGALGFLLPKFGTLRPNEMTDEMLLRMAEGDDALAYWRSSRKCHLTEQEDEVPLWDTPVLSKSKRPWTHFMKRNFLVNVRAFRNWMHSSKDPITKKKRNWCPPFEMEIDPPPRIVPQKTGKAHEGDEVLDAECKRSPALTIAQCQALLDASFIIFDGRYAAFYVHALFGGSRVKETKKMGAKGFDAEEGVQSISAEAAKTDEGRESTLYDNLIIMVSALKSAGLYADQNLRPDSQSRTVINILSGFSSNDKAAIKRATRERERLAGLGMVIPPQNWGILSPRNSMRRTSLSMHYKLFGSEALTVAWAGNSIKIFRPFYKRLVTKADARQFWVMLPSVLKSGNLVVNLPANHKLDSAMTKEVSAAIPVACQAMRAAAEKLAAAKSALSNARPIAFRKRQSENRKAGCPAAHQVKAPDNAEGFHTFPNPT